MKNKSYFFIIPIIMIFIIGTYLLLTRNQQFEYNDQNAVGNSAGNLNNGGSFCENNGIIYFSNPYDDDKLYSMNSDCTNVKKLNNDSVSSINVQGKYLYYVKNNFISTSIGVVFHGQLYGIYRCDLTGKNAHSLYGNLSGKISLSGNHIYYQHYDKENALSFFKVEINNSEKTKISMNEYNPSSVYKGKIYFTNIVENHNINVLDTSNDSISTYYTGNTYSPDMQGEYLYFIDLSNGYSLVRLNTETKSVELLSDGRCINYNVYGDKIFYEKEGEDSGLYRMNSDGSKKENVASGNFTNIHCTSKYTFFQYFENPNKLYRVLTNGPLSNPEEVILN